MKNNDKNKELDVNKASEPPCQANTSAPQKKSKDEEKVTSSKRNILFTVLFIAIAGLTVYAITAQTQSFSMSSFISFLTKVNPIWIIAAFLCMLGFILFEGFALLTICKGFGYKRGFWSGYHYSASDIYVSAITPSASGGQPASAYFMVRDGIPSSLTTVILLINLVLYIFAILIIALVCFAVMPLKILAFSTLSKVLIGAGTITLLGLAIIFILLLKKPNILHGLCRRCIKILGKLRLIKKTEAKYEKLNVWIKSYTDCAQAMKGKKAVIIKALIFNILQRISQVMITVFAFLSIGGSFSTASEVFVMQEMVVVGSNCIPIPGAMGVADYLMLDAFSNVVSAETAVNFELLARSISFYLCVILCGCSFFLKLFLLRRKKKK